ncbi:hypothetical protein BHM03_00004297 [Ensete ventricosum]|uniref:Uncharacterized protein n=1 Tax=Ensete ventricosum TaxID=4639 RepID=A0A445MAL2_ENSVE|nr:hypothetical protein BHM03_00004297 [Ensete ventricosum]
MKSKSTDVASAGEFSQEIVKEKQVRRRLRTSRPYQERLLNMAEARREIMNEYRRNSRIYTPNYTFPNYAHNTKLSPFTYPSFSWIYPPITRLSVSDDLNSPFPNQPLGLNLNLQSFNNNDESFCNNLSRKPSIQPSSCSNSPATIMSSIKIPCISNISCQASGVPLDPAPVSLHPMMDDDEIAEIRLIGEQHDMEWNDKMNLMTSAWWSKYLKNMEGGLCEKEDPDEAGFQMFDEVFNMPSWLSNEGDAKESCLFQPHMNSDYNEDAYMHDAAFPW